MKIIKFIVLICFLTSVHEDLYSQSADKDSLNKNLTNFSPKIGIEFFLIPTGAYFNSANLGICFQKNNRIEYSFILGSRLIPIYSTFNLNANFNSNFYSRNGKSYLPVWFRISNTRTDYSCGECEESSPHTLRFSIGTGYGRKTRLTRNFYLRTEIGTGLSVNFVSTAGDVFPYVFNPSDYYFDKYKYPRLFPTLKLKFTFAKMFDVATTMQTKNKA